MSTPSTPYIPKPGDVFVVGDHRFTVMSIKGLTVEFDRPIMPTWTRFGLLDSVIRGLLDLGVAHWETAVVKTSFDLDLTYDGENYVRYGEDPVWVGINSSTLVAQLRNRPIRVTIETIDNPAPTDQPEGGAA
jgi:hypothetical protein